MYRTMVEKIDALFVATYIDFILDFAENTIFNAFIAGSTLIQRSFIQLDAQQPFWKARECAKSSLVGDEDSYLPNCQTNLVITLHVVSLFLAFHKPNSLPLGSYELQLTVTLHSLCTKVLRLIHTICSGLHFSLWTVVNAEMGNFLSPCRNATVCHRRTQKSQ